MCLKSRIPFPVRPTWFHRVVVLFPHLLRRTRANRNLAFSCVITATKQVAHACSRLVWFGSWFFWGSITQTRVPGWGRQQTPSWCGSRSFDRIARWFFWGGGGVSSEVVRQSQENLKYRVHNKGRETCKIHLYDAENVESCDRRRNRKCLNLV